VSGSEPVVPHLVLAPEPHLVASRCLGCDATFVVPRAACPACGGRDFASVRLPTTGTVRTWSVVRRPPPDAVVPAPYVPVVVTLTGGCTVSATLVDTDPALVRHDLPVELTTFDAGDRVAFGFRAS
jgi:uncharacterized OB-fold protein